MDYAEKDGVYFFVVVNAHSKWPEVFSTSSTTTHKTIEMLSHLFAAYGLPEEIVSDNGPQFMSDEMLHFIEEAWDSAYSCSSLSPSLKWGSREIRLDTKASLTHKQD